MISELNQLFGDIIIQSEHTTNPKETSFPVSNTLRHIDVKTRGISLEISMATVHEECQKLIVAMVESESYITMKNGVKGRA